MRNFIRNIKDYLLIGLLILFIIVVIGLIIFAIGMTIYCWITFGNLPPDEVPTWAHWWMLWR